MISKYVPELKNLLDFWIALFLLWGNGGSKFQTVDLLNIFGFSAI